MHVNYLSVKACSQPLSYSRPPVCGRGVAGPGEVGEILRTVATGSTFKWYMYVHSYKEILGLHVSVYQVGTVVCIGDTLLADKCMMRFLSKS